MTISIDPSKVTLTNPLNCPLCARPATVVDVEQLGNLLLNDHNGAYYRFSLECHQAVNPCSNLLSCSVELPAVAVTVK